MITASTANFHVGPDNAPDKYRLLRMVGSGGEAQLWQAELMVAGGTEPVAVKVLRPEHSGDFARLSVRWSEQAELLRFVRHPGVVGVREHFEGAPLHAPNSPASGERQLYLVMNWVEGQSLRDWAVLHQGAAATLQALQHLDQIAEVLDLLHSGSATPGGRALVHGDLSPGNVMIDHAGQAILIDFGLIRTIKHRTAGPMGTHGFAAPEVWSAGEYSPTADRYSFGAVAYFVLIGSPPAGSYDQIRRGLTSNPLLAARNPVNIDWLLTIFSDDPGQRPPSALQWVRLLRNTATTTHPPGPAPSTVPPSGPAASTMHTIPPYTRLSDTSTPSRRSQRSRWAAALAAAVVVGGAITVGATAFRPGVSGGGTPNESASTTAALPGPTPAITPTQQSTGQAGSTTTRSPAQTSEPGPAPSFTVRRESGATPLQLADGYVADLDSRAANWDVQRGLSGDLRAYAGALSAGVDLSPVSGPPDYNTCRATTDYYKSINLANIDPGYTFCVRTNQGRYAHVVIRSPSIPVTLDVTVWDPPNR